MGQSFRKTASTTGRLLFVIGGIGSMFAGVYRLKRIPQKANSPGRRARRLAMRQAMEREPYDPAYAAEMEREMRVWESTVGDGLSDC